MKMNILLMKNLCFLGCLVAALAMSCPAAAQVGSGGAGGSSSGSVSFPFENYDYFVMDGFDDLMDLVPVNRHDLGLYTLAEVADPATTVNPVAALGDNGQGFVMVNNDDEVGVEDVIVVVSGFGPFPGVAVNQSGKIAEEIRKKLKDRGIDGVKVIIDVFWDEPDKKIDEVVTDVRKNNPDEKIVWIALGQGGGFTVETQGDNNQDPTIPDANGNLPTVGLNEPGGPAVVDGEYDGTGIVDVLDDLGVTITESTDAGNYICDSTTYKLHRCDAAGKIDLGIFFHVPANPTQGEVDIFTDGVIDVLLGPYADPDGDGRINLEDGYPFDPTMN